MTVGSLFSGIGGLELGLEWAGMRTIWQCEADEAARTILSHHWPDIPCYPDVRDIDWNAIERPDLICGGFPCQDISHCNTKATGIDGNKSGLWRYLYASVRALRPDWVLVENVAALRHRGADRVLTELEEADYTCWPSVVGAGMCGAPHRRHRVFIVAHSNSARIVRDRRPDSLGGEGQSGRTLHIGHEVSDTGTSQVSRDRDADLQRSDCHGPQNQPGVGRVIDGISAWMDGTWEEGVARTAQPSRGSSLRLRTLGNAVVPQVAFALGRAILLMQKNFEQG